MSTRLSARIRTADVGSETKHGGLCALKPLLPEWLPPDIALLDADADGPQLRPYFARI